jgi:DNA-binding CsgD family transcriptional regulator
LSEADEAAPLALAPLALTLRVRDPALADRLARLLGAVPGLSLVPDAAGADAVVEDARPVPGDAALTPRELEVLALLTEGASNKAVARALGISVHTAKFHVGRVLDKLDATGRTDAVAQAARVGVIRL